MTEERTIDAIESYHAHVYYDAESKPRAAAVREAVDRRFGGAVVLGRWHDKPVGPHPCWSYQIAFEPTLFAELVPWLSLNRDGLTVFVHPQSGESVPDHVDHAIWLGEQYEIDASVLS
jgi:DOPA 4,5-dioxygenase